MIEKRSLQEFADQPLADLSEQYDLLPLWRPYLGVAHRCGHPDGLVAP